MKSVWMMLSTLAVANLLALLGFVGFLQATDRLDPARVERVRRILTETRSEEAARLATEQADAEAERLAGEEAAKAAIPPRTAAQKLDERSQAEEADRQRHERVRREVDDLRRSLQRERAAVDEARARLSADQAEFDAMRTKIAAVEGDAQFRKALGVYEAIKPAEAKAALQEVLMPGGGVVSPDGLDQVIAYLNAMQERVRTKIVQEFVKDDPKVAADLLEHLRTRGLEARGPEDPPE